MIKSTLWFLYDIFFSAMICNAIGFIALEHFTNFQWYWVAILSVSFLICGYYIVVFSKNKNRLYRSLVADLISADSRIDFNLTYFPLFGFVVTFALINQQLFMSSEDLYTITDIYNWPFDTNIDMLFYAYDNFFRAVCLDLFETYNLHISRIGSNNLGILTLNFSYKIFLSIFFIKSLFEIFKTLKKYKATCKNL